MVYVGSSWTEIDWWSDTLPSGYKIYWRLVAKSSQDVPSNTSRIDFKWQTRVTGGSAYNSDTHTYEVSGSDEKNHSHNASVSWKFGTVTSENYVDVGDSDYWGSVYHADDGTYSETAHVSGTRWNNDKFSDSYTLTLPTIPRASVPTASPNPATVGANGVTVTINTNRKASSFMHTVSLTCGSWTWSSSAKAVGASVAVTIPYSVIAQFSATSKTATYTITCVTFSGNTNIGTKTSTFTLQIDPSVDHPNIGTIAVEDTNSRTSSIVGADTFIYGISTLQATIPLTVSGSYTELASAVVTCGNRSQTYSLSGTSQTLTFTFDKVNASSLAVKVTDKRGTSVTKTKSYTLMPYQPETLTATVGRVTATGSTAVGQVSGVAYGGNYGQASNELTITYRYKEHDATTWTDSAYTATLTLTEGQQTYTHAITLLEDYDYQKQYDIQFVVNDLFNTATYECRLMQGLPILSWDETEVDVWGNLHIHDRDNPTSWQDVMEGFDAYADDQKNVLPCMSASNPATSQGITFTRMIQSTLTTYINVNGTATGRAFYNVNESFELVSGRKYILSGLHDEWVQGFSVWLRYSANETVIAVAYDEDVEFTAPSETMMVYLFVGTGTVVSNKKWYPMIRDARIASPTYVPYRPLSKRWPMGVSVYTSGSRSIAAGASGSVEISITNPLNGRKPFAILRTWSNENIVISYCSTASNTNLSSVTVWYRNTTSGTVSCTFSVEILYIDANFVM